jgi:hypothetical protein
MPKARTILCTAIFTQITLAGVQAEPLACYTQFGDVWFKRADHPPVLLPYNQCVRYLGRDGSYVRVRVGLRGLESPTEGWIFAGNVYCRPGSCLRWW